MHLMVDSYITEILPEHRGKYYFTERRNKVLNLPPSSQSVVQSCKEAQVQR